LDVTIERGRFILGESVDSTEAGMKTIREGEVDDPINGAERNGRFGSIPGKGVESLPPAAC
jgi:hypothetical protein